MLNESCNPGEKFRILTPNCFLYVIERLTAGKVVWTLTVSGGRPCPPRREESGADTPRRKAVRCQSRSPSRNQSCPLQNRIRTGTRISMQNKPGIIVKSRMMFPVPFFSIRKMILQDTVCLRSLGPFYMLLYYMQRSRLLGETVIRLLT